MTKMTSTYEDLLIEYEDELEIYEHGMALKGLYADGIVFIDKNLTETEKACVLAEEIGHHETSYGNILSLTDLSAIKQEMRARRWAHNKMLSLNDLIVSFEKGCRNKYEIAEYLNLTEDFLEEALCHFSKIHGLYKQVDNYVLYFEPLSIFKSF